MTTAHKTFKTPLFISTISLLVIALAAGIVACTIAKPDGKIEEPNIQEKHTLCGGYTEQRSVTEEEMKMFAELTEASDTLFTPLSVATQVVAGLNYKFHCTMSAKDASGDCFVIIYQPLEGKPYITSVIPSNE